MTRPQRGQDLGLGLMILLDRIVPARFSSKSRAARAADMSVPTLNRYLWGGTDPQFRTLRRILSAWGYTLADLEEADAEAEGDVPPGRAGDGG